MWPTAGVILVTLPKNVGKTDQTIRMVVAGMLVVAGILSGYAFLSIIGLVVLATGYTGVCPAYIPFKINTNKEADEDD
jgi:hypothetical protein